MAKLRGPRPVDPLSMPGDRSRGKRGPSEGTRTCGAATAAALMRFDPEYQLEVHSGVDCVQPQRARARPSRSRRTKNDAKNGPKSQKRAFLRRLQGDGKTRVPCRNRSNLPR